MGRPRKIPASIVQPDDPSIRVIPLTQGKVAMVDAEDYEKVSAFAWYAVHIKRTDKWYAARGITQPDGSMRQIRMHVFILGKKEGLEIDHWDTDGLNNRRHNLRWATHSQNMMNMSEKRRSHTGVKGVHKSTTPGKFEVMIRIDGKPTYVGVFDSVGEGASAYAELAQKHFGKFARTA